MPELEAARPAERQCLLIDQGSSRIKWIGAVWSAMTQAWSLDVTTFSDGGPGELTDALNSGEMLPPEEVLLCSVAADDGARQLQDAIAECCSAPLVRLRSQAESGGVRNGYRKPEQLGADRWMAVVAAAVHYGLPAVVMDVGTATTLDAVDASGQHLGGLILPGPAAMLGALGDTTALRLEEYQGKPRPRRRQGQPQSDTLSAIQGGILSAQMGALHEFIRWCEQGHGGKNSDNWKRLATGGGAGVILGQSDYQLTHDPLLIFKGMLICRFGLGDH